MQTCGWARQAPTTRASGGWTELRSTTTAVSGSAVQTGTSSLAAMTWIVSSLHIGPANYMTNTVAPAISLFAKYAPSLMAQQARQLKATQKTSLQTALQARLLQY